tara:strand:+ start:61476 stop:62861 length:1386 start_codon:yes stop_codon:yes gene_type:complete
MSLDKHLLRVKKSVNLPDVGASVPAIAAIAAVIAVLAIAAGVYLYRTISAEVAHQSIGIASGPPSGSYYAVGMALQRLFDNTPAFPRVDVMITDGSVENAKLMADPDVDVDLAFVQGDETLGADVRLVTVLFEESLHILVPRSVAAEITSIFDLQGKRVALGLAGSGNRALAQKILRHFGVVVGESLFLSPAEAAAGLVDGSLDAAMMVATIPSQLIHDLAQQDAIRFISVSSDGDEGGETHALELLFPGLKRSTIPRGTYGRLPLQAINTIGVDALLVAPADVNNILIRAITALIFANRSSLAGPQASDSLPARIIRENYAPALITVPYHPGATAYYRREEPPFFVEYAEALSLGLTLMLAMYSGYIAFRELIRRRMKNRVDAYLLEVERLASNVHAMGLEDLLARQATMEALRRAAFADLVEERLLADEAFTILQSHLRDELNELASIIRARESRLDNA